MPASAAAHAPPNDASHPVFPGTGEMATRCRALDWSRTPLGAPDTWAPALRWAVRTALESPFPINLWCGPRRVLIYNDGYRHVMGSKHPAGLGRSGDEVWAEIWPQIEPMFAQIDAGGPPVYADDAPFVIEREGPIASDEGGPNAWFTFSLSPVRGESGEVVAYLNVVSETTRRLLAERATEEARREAVLAEARLRDVFAQAPAFLAVLRGPRFVFDVVNEAYYQLVGKRDLVGRAVFDALPEVRGQGFEELLAGVVETGIPFVGREVPLTVNTGDDGVPEQRFVDLVYYPLNEADGTRSGVVAHGSDVTAQVLARQAVERLGERLRLALQAADIGTWDFDPLSGVLSWDERSRELFGLAPDEESGLDHFVALLHPDDRERTAAAMNGAMDPAGNGDYLVEYRAMLPDGGVRWIRAAGRALFEGEGAGRHPIRFIGTVIDVSQRVEHERERDRLLREAELQRERLEQIFTEAPAVMALYTGPEHVVTLVNPTWEKTVGKPDAIGRRFRDVFPEFAGSGLFELLDHTYATGEPFVDPEVNVPLERWGSGEMEDTWWHLVWRPLSGGDPGSRDILVHAVEVTEQVRARREVEQKVEELARLTAALEASNGELDQFAYVASHDLKAPLRGIANLSQWIEDDMADRLTDDTRNNLELLRGRVHRMEGLIDGILEYSRAGRVREKAERVDAAELAGDVVDLIAPPPTVQVEVDVEGPPLVTERIALQQVLMNLVSNAVKFTAPGGGRVRVEGRGVPGGWEFSVSDSGPGIAPEYHERIWGIFQTLQPRDRMEGTGIGLSIVKKLVESRGGRVWLESQAGQGATFHVHWPAAPRT